MLKIKPGYILDNKYEIKKIVAKGAMGAVFKAEVTDTKEVVALKVPLPGFDQELSSLQRFQQAEKIQCILAHPNIVKAFKPQHEKSFPYVIMEYVDGPSMEYLISQSRRLSIEDATNYTIQMCSVLDYLQITTFVFFTPILTLFRPLFFFIFQSTFRTLKNFY